MCDASQLSPDRLVLSSDWWCSMQSCHSIALGYVVPMVGGVQMGGTHPCQAEALTCQGALGPVLIHLLILLFVAILLR